LHGGTGPGHSVQMTPLGFGPGGALHSGASSHGQMQMPMHTQGSGGGGGGGGGGGAGLHPSTGQAMGQMGHRHGYEGGLVVPQAPPPPGGSYGYASASASASVSST